MQSKGLSRKPLMLLLLGAAAAAAESLQSYLTLCDPIDGSPPSSSVPGILKVRILEWVAISFSNACMHAKSLQSCPTLCYPTRLLCPQDSPGLSGYKKCLLKGTPIVLKISELTESYN